jgi:hypothetical protein
MLTSRESKLIFDRNGKLRMNFKVQDEAQYFLDGLTIKHVHYQTGTPAFLIQHCYGLRGPKRRMNALEA